MRISRITTKTLLRILFLIKLFLHQRNIATVNQIVEELGCSKATAYQYQRTLRRIFPLRPFPQRRSPDGSQQNLDNY